MVAERTCDCSDLTQIKEELLLSMEELITDPVSLNGCEMITDRVEQIKQELLLSIMEHGCNEVTVGLTVATKDKALVFDELYLHVRTWKEKLQEVITHRRSATALIDWANEVNKLEKQTAAARVAGYGTAISGTVVLAVGSGLLLGGVTALAGIPLMAIGGGVGATGSLAAIAGCAAKYKMMKSLRQKAQLWLEEHQTLCRALIDAHDTLMERKAQVEECYPDVDVDEKLTELFNAEIPQALAGVDEVVGNWKKALLYGPEEVISIITAMCGTGTAVAQGLIEGVDTGAEVVAIAIKATAKLAGASVAVGLSALMIAADIGLLAKASYDLHQSRKGKPTKLAQAMNDLAADIERENRLLEDAGHQFID